MRTSAAAAALAIALSSCSGGSDASAYADELYESAAALHDAWTTWVRPPPPGTVYAGNPDKQVSDITTAARDLRLQLQALDPPPADARLIHAQLLEVVRVLDGFTRTWFDALNRALQHRDPSRTVLDDTAIIDIRETVGALLPGALSELRALRSNG